MAPTKKKKKDKKRKCMYVQLWSLLLLFLHFIFVHLTILFWCLMVYNFSLLFFFVFVIAVVSFSQRKGPRLASCYWPILKHNQQIHKNRNKQTTNILWQGTMMCAPFTYNDSSFRAVCVCSSKSHLDVMEALSACTLGH